MEFNKEKIAERLKALRRDNSIEEVAEAVGITPASMRAYENAERVPNDYIKIKLAEYFDVTVESIFFEK